ncbi:MAG: N4-gp56 family major capsid protein, partial [Candidatus Thorarchaeota archaeon]|nr:N4-gp56 family major capsid protein [Candidatus Thorarchaeota archaeon]
NTYGNIFFGAEAFGTVDISSMGLKMYRKPQGSAGTEDPIDQRATIGYKYSYAAKVLEAARVQVLWAYGV